MIAELSTARPAKEATKLWMHGPPLPSANRAPLSPFPNSIELPYPAIEELPCFVRRIDSGCLSPGVRHYNGSVCRHMGRIFMAYRFESYSAVSRVGVCEMDGDFNVLRDRVLSPSIVREGEHIEDPHMASASGKLICVVACVFRDVITTCQQRIIEVDPDTLEAGADVPHALGNVNGVEKNWTPFELPDGSLGVVYKQRPRTLARVSDSEGWVHEGPDMRQPGEGSSISGRCGPLRLADGTYLEFVGGHVKLPTLARRGTRYWFGALIFEGTAPHRVVARTERPLAWASEASPTIFNPLPGGGHPVCILPAGAMFHVEQSGDVVVSCGVNDSYIVMLRFKLDELLSEMKAV